VTFNTVGDKKNGKKKEITCFRFKKVGHYAVSAQKNWPERHGAMQGHNDDEGADIEETQYEEQVIKDNDSKETETDDDDNVKGYWVQF